jgi:hypothetical protein
MKVMNITSITSSLAEKTNILKNSASRHSEIANRAANIYNYGETKAKVVKTSQRIVGYINPILNKIKTDSPTISSLSKMFNSIKNNILTSKKEARAINGSMIGATIKGIKNSKKELINGLKEASGVNDVILANKHGGTGKAICEGGKSALRLVASSALSAACTPVPVPGACIGGWFAGEKLVEKLVGKPFSQQIKNIK